MTKEDGEFVNQGIVGITTFITIGSEADQKIRTNAAMLAYKTVGEEHGTEKFTPDHIVLAIALMASAEANRKDVPYRHRIAVIKKMWGMLDKNFSASVSSIETREKVIDNNVLIEANGFIGKMDDEGKVVPTITASALRKVLSTMSPDAEVFVKTREGIQSVSDVHPGFAVFALRGSVLDDATGPDDLPQDGRKPVVLLG